MREPSSEVRAHLRELGMVSSAIFAGVVLFAGVVWYLMNLGGFTPPEGMPAYLSMVLNLVALFALALAGFLPRTLLPPPAGPSEGELLAWHKKTTILAFAVREGGAFLALVGVILTGRQLGGFAVVALVLVSMAMAWPREDQLHPLP